MAQFEDRSFDKKGALWPFLKRIFRYSFRYKKWMIWFCIWVCIVAIADAAFPLVLLGMLDNVVTPQLEALKAAMDAGIPFEMDFSGVWLYAGLFLLIGIIQIIGIYFFIKLTGKVQEYVMYDLREEMFRKLQKLSFSFYDRSASGWLLTRLTSDTDRVCEVISWGLLDAFWGITMIFFCLGSMFIFNWKLGLVVLIAIPVMLVASVKIRMLVLKYSREARKLNSELTASFNEHINGVEVNKSTTQEYRVSLLFRGLSGRMRLSSYRAAFYTAMYVPVVLLIGSVAAAAVIFWGGSMAIAVSTGITIGVLAASFEYAMKIFFPIVDISMFYALAQGSLSAGERIFSLLDEDIDVKNKEEATHIGAIEGQIEFQNVDFHYVEGHPVLKDFNLNIKKGQSIALVGATGEGKSTIINLVCRFYEPTGGLVLIDGKDYMDHTLQSLRSQLGIVLQTPHLFSGTIKENIVYGRSDATEKEVEAALRLVSGEDFLARLDEEVGEGGDQLSMGEKQLISFARAILADPKIFIMDEATSSIDTLTEAKIQEGIGKMLEGRTSIIIAHRLSTIKNCDRILVISKGAILEDGSHKTLMKQKGKYYQLYTRQLRKERLADLVG
ncbi:MAG: ABC transporter ATP-binding protein [Bacteroidota bacterium]